MVNSEARRFSEKSACQPCCESPLKYSAISYSCWLFGKQIANSAHRSVIGLLFITYGTAVDSGAMNKVGLCMYGVMNILGPARMLLFSVSNGTMNTPQYWQQRNETLHDIGNSAMNPPQIGNSAINPAALQRERETPSRRGRGEGRHPVVTILLMCRSQSCNQSWCYLSTQFLEFITSVRRYLLVGTRS
jgi:hypothetical protein